MFLAWQFPGDPVTVGICHLKFKFQALVRGCRDCRSRAVLCWLSPPRLCAAVVLMEASASHRNPGDAVGMDTPVPLQIGKFWSWMILCFMFLWGLNELLSQQLFFCPLPDIPSLLLKAKKVHSVSCALHTPELLVLCHLMCLLPHVCRLECSGAIYSLSEVWKLRIQICGVWRAGNSRGNPSSMRNGTERIFRAPWDKKQQHTPTSCFPLQHRGRSSFSQPLNHHSWDTPNAAGAPQSAVLCHQPQPVRTWCMSRMTLGGCRGDLAVNQRHSLGDKREDVKHL